MADAWTTLTAGSTIDDGDAWDHIQAQGGGGGTATYLVLADGLGVDMAINDFEIELSADVEATVDPADIAVTIDQSPKEVDL